MISFLEWKVSKGIAYKAFKKTYFDILKITHINIDLRRFY